MANWTKNSKHYEVTLIVVDQYFSMPRIPCTLLENLVLFWNAQSEIEKVASVFGTEPKQIPAYHALVFGIQHDRADLQNVRFIHVQE